MKALYLYQDAGCTAIEHFLQSLPLKQQERLLRQIAMLLLPQLGKPPVKHKYAKKRRGAGISSRRFSISGKEWPDLSRFSKNDNEKDIF